MSGLLLDRWALTMIVMVALLLAGVLVDLLAGGWRREAAPIFTFAAICSALAWFAGRAV